MTREHAFRCPLPNGLHARPASELAEVAGRFRAAVALTNERTGGVADARSVLELVALDVRLGDACRVRVTGEDAGPAHAALREFVERVLPSCDEALPAPAEGIERALPRVLRGEELAWCAGTVVSPGIGLGVVVRSSALALTTEMHGPAASPDEERAKVRRARAAVRAALAAKLAESAGPVASGLLRAQLAMLDDVGFARRVEGLLAEGEAAGRAIVRAATSFAETMRAASSAYVRERALDVEDLGLQMLEELGERVLAPLELREPSIVVAESLAPRQLLALELRFLEALVLEHAGATSHAVILARSFGVPALVGVAEARARLGEGREAVVDAHLGLVIAGVTPRVRRHYERERAALRRRAERLARSARAPAATRDGQRLEVGANVATAEELAPAFERGADGIGLFRTEMLFMERAAPPSEEEQLAVYAQAARAAGGRPVLLRTFDVGGDKPVPYLHLAREANPFLGQRGVRVYPAHLDVFRTQLRAIARAAAHGAVRLLVPMVATLDEVRWVKARLAEVLGELHAEGLAHEPALPVGVMLEVPSAALHAGALAGEVDFFSIGTNDLTQYLFAADREDARLGALASVLHPAFLGLLARIVADAHRHGRWVGLCGEMARDPRHLPLLIGLGLDEISTAAPEIPALKAAVARASAADCRALLARALACGSAAEVGELLDASPGSARGLLDPELVILGSDSADKPEALHELVAALSAAGRTDRPQELEDAIWAREAVYSTGLGHGFAIPHCKSDALAASSLAVLRLARPIEWGALDGQPVECVLLLALRASEPADAHMKVFAKLARKLMHEDFRARLLAARDGAQLLGGLAEELGLTSHHVC